jgi:hypothetical protein
MSDVSQKTIRRDARVVDRGGLENRCTLKVPRVRIPLSPPDLVRITFLGYKSKKRPFLSASVCVWAIECW